MQKIVARTPQLAVGLAACAGLLAAGGAGWALGATGASSIHACASKKNGALRLAARCGRKERAVSWSVQGPAGGPGQPGQRFRCGRGINTSCTGIGEAIPAS
jgi:hypothetical protein